MTDMTWLQSTSINLISIVIVLTFAARSFKDFFRGGSGSAKASSFHARGGGYRHFVHVYRVERRAIGFTIRFKPG